MTLAPRNPVLFLLALVAIIAGAAGTFVAIAPNRLVSGAPITLWQADGATGFLLVACAAALFCLSFFAIRRGVMIVVLVLALAALLLLIFDAAAYATVAMIVRTPAARVSLGAGFWIIAFCLAMMAIDALQRLSAGVLLRASVLVIGAAAIATLAASGWLDGLSLAREYAAHRAEFGAELGRHCQLVLAAVVLAVVIGAPLGVFAARRPQSGAGIFGVLNLLQTIPSVALFGVLIVPLSAVGIGGIGAVPAIIALVLYSLLPFARNTAAGIESVEPSIIDAARGMGLTPTQILWRIELPLGLPVFIAGLRIVTVQAIGLTVVAALIGAGGLGSFVFQGIGQYAIDLVLLGALPTIGLALAADFVLALLAELCRKGVA